MTTMTLNELVVNLTTGPTPHLELDSAMANGSLARLIPELAILKNVPAPVQHHPEVCTHIHMVLTMEAAALLTDRPRARFAALVHDLGKGLTPQSEWPKHVSHEERGVPLVEALCARFNAPADWELVGKLASKWHLLAHTAFNLRAATVVKMLVETEFLEQEDVFEDFLLACEADKRGRAEMLYTDYPQASYLRAARQAVLQVPLLPEEDLNGRRTTAVKRVRAQYPD